MNDNHAGRLPQVKSLSRSTRVLRTLAVRPMKPVDLARELEEPWATIYRTVRALADEGMLQRNPDTGEYSIGSTMWALATSYVRDHPVLGVGLGHLEQLLPNIPGMLKLTERCDDQTVTLFVEQNPLAPRVHRIREQFRMPLHVASYGHVLLAYAPPDFINTYLGGPFHGLSNEPKTDPVQLRAELDRVRDSGFALSREHVQRANGSVSVPVGGKDGQVVAALSAVLPLKFLDSPTLIDEQCALLRHTARTISDALGRRLDHGPEFVVPT